MHGVLVFLSETWFHCVPLAVLNLKKSTCLCLLSAGIKGVCHHCLAPSTTATVLSSELIAFPTAHSGHSKCHYSQRTLQGITTDTIDRKAGAEPAQDVVQVVNGWMDGWMDG